MNQKIRIKLKSYDHNLLDKSSEKIVRAVKATGAVVSGPIPLPTEKEKYTVLRSPHVNKKSREQFQLCTFKHTDPLIDGGIICYRRNRNTGNHVVYGSNRHPAKLDVQGVEQRVQEIGRAHV